MKTRLSWFIAAAIALTAAGAVWAAKKEITMMSSDDLKWVDVPEASTITLSTGPVPSKGILRVTYAAEPGDARLELLDIGGRKIETLTVHTSRSPAAHAFGAQGSLRPGLYFVRLTQGNRVLVRRALLVR